MEHIYPAFERGRIMKKELLWALRDYSYSALELQYKDYADGIISGCKIRVEDNLLYIAPGIMKCQGFIFLFTEESQIEYAPTEYSISLKFRLIAREVLSDYVKYETEFVLDETLERRPNEIELCRFKLKEGARLRTDYKDFFDIQTEFDTVNLANATWAAVGENTLSKEITDYYAKKVMECAHADVKDIQFAYFLLQSKEAIRCEVLRDYIARKTGCESRENGFDAEETFAKLEEILDGIRRGKDIYGQGRIRQDNRMIILD